MLILKGSSALIQDETNAQEWADLYKQLNANAVQELSFANIHYYEYSHGFDLLSALGNCRDLRSIQLTESTFSPLCFGKTKNLEWLVDGLKACQNLETLSIGRYGAESLDKAFRGLTQLIERSNNIKVLKFSNLKINGSNFKFLCLALARSPRNITLQFDFNVLFSEPNKILLEQALQANRNINVLGGIRGDLRAAKPENIRDSRFCWTVVSGFIIAIGITAVAVGLIALTPATVGGAGFVLAVAGVTAILTGMGIFALSRCAAPSDQPDKCIDTCLPLC